MSKIFGIIGGNGVAATNKLLELIENNLTIDGAYRDCHHPEMIIYQATKAPSRSMFIEGRGESFIEDYITISKKLEYIGADTICMCCNTAHYAIDEISKSVKIEFINLVEEVVKKVKNINKKNIGLMVSDGSKIAGIYEKYLYQIFPEVNIIYPNSKMQSHLTLGICNVKNAYRFSEDNNPNRPKNIFKSVEKHLLDMGADIVIAGCTDIRVDFEPSKNVIDSLEILSNLILEQSRAEQSRAEQSRAEQICFDYIYFCNNNNAKFKKIQAILRFHIAV